MKKAVLTFVIGLLVVAPAFAQQAQREAEIKRAVPYSTMLRQFPGMTWEDYNAAVRGLAKDQLENERKQSASDAPRVWQQTPSRPVYTPPVYTPPSTYTPPPTYTPRVYTPRASGERQSGTTYDWQSGNTYNWRKRSNGETDVDGFNLNTGSMWNTTIKPNGSMRGTDSKMNPWTYDSKSKTYMNYGTGKMCFGEGYARVCSGG